MKDKLVLGFVVLFFFGFPSFSCYAQSLNNEQRIVGTWIYSAEGFNSTLVFNADGSGSITRSWIDNGALQAFAFGISITGALGSSHSYIQGKVPYFSPDGRNMIFDGYIYRKR
jgi:hypothetical protein